MPSLTGISQKAVSRYLFCGLEFLVPHLSRIFSIALLVIGSLILIVTVVLIKRKNKPKGEADNVEAGEKQEEGITDS